MEPRSLYKLPTQAVDQNDNMNFAAEPRQTTLARHQQKYAEEFEVHLLFPEHIHDRLFIKQICGSATTANQVDDLFKIRYVTRECILVYHTVVYAVVLASLGYTMVIDEAVPPWFPYLGTAFYTSCIPMLFLALVCEVSTYKVFLNVDDRMLKLLTIVAVLSCFVVSPTYGAWTTVSNLSLPKNGSVHESIGLYVGAYCCCALYMSMWIVPFVYANVFIERLLQDAKCVKQPVMQVFKFAVITAILFGSMIHQAIVEVLIWFPYLGVIGIYFIIPVICVLCYILLLSSLEEYVSLSNSTCDILMALTFMGVTDGLVWMLAKRNINQQIDLLLEDQFLYGGAIIFYSFMSLLWLGFVFQMYNESK